MNFNNVLIGSEDPARLADVEGVRREVAGVGDLADKPRLDLKDRVIRSQELRGRPNRRRAESRARPV